MPEHAATVDSVEAWLVRLPLPAPLSIAPATIKERDYTLVRVRDSDGVEGCAFGLARGAPVDLVVSDLLAAAVVGASAAPSELAARCEQALVMLGEDGLTGRARSLLDICAWDIAGQRSGEPVWRLLRSDPSSPPPRTPCMLVEGYPVPEETPERFAERLQEAHSVGFGSLKLALSAEPATMDRRLELVRQAVGATAKLTLDCGWSWRTLEPAEQAARLWARHDLAWLEDPFPAGMADLTAALRRRTGVPIAAGDELSRGDLVERLVAADAVDVVRLDATTIGGFSGFARLVASTAGTSVSPHALPEIHSHCVFAWPQVAPLELFRPGAGFDMTHVFVEPPVVRDGEIDLPTAPGLGLAVDWEAVRAHALRHATVREPAGLR